MEEEGKGEKAGRFLFFFVHATSCPSIPFSPYPLHRRRMHMLDRICFGTRALDGELVTRPIKNANLFFIGQFFVQGTTQPWTLCGEMWICKVSSHSFTLAEHWSRRSRTSEGLQDARLVTTTTTTRRMRTKTWMHLDQ